MNDCTFSYVTGKGNVDIEASIYKRNHHSHSVYVCNCARIPLFLCLSVSSSSGSLLALFLHSGEQLSNFYQRNL